MIPNDWVRCKLGKLAKIKTGGTPRRMEPHYWGGDIPWMSSGEIHKRYINDTKEFITEDGLKSSNACLLPQGTVMIALNGQGRTRSTVAILRTPVTCNQSLAGFITHNNILNADYLFFYLDSKYQSLRDLSGDHGRNGLNLKLLREIEIDLPPLPEQKKIAAILSSMDDAIQATQAVIDQTSRVKQGLLHQLLTNGIGHTRFKKTEIGEIPEEWELLPFDQVLDVRSGKGFRLDEYVDEGIKLLRIDNVSWGEITWDSIAYLPTHYADEYPELLLKEGDILLALNRPITQGKLKLAILKREDSPAILYQRVGKILFKNGNTEVNFTYQLLNHLLPPFIVEKSVGSDQPFINITALRKLKLPIPTLNEQHKIAAILGKNDECIETHNKSLEYMFSIKRGLMQDLLTGRVRVKSDEVNTT